MSTVISNTPIATAIPPVAETASASDGTPRVRVRVAIALTIK
jgi:hypothetical protein